MTISTTKPRLVSLAKAMTCALAAFAMSSVNANAQTVIVNDSFEDGITANGPDQIGFNITSSPAGLNVDQAPGPVDFASGDSGRSIHGLFPAQTLEEFGDVLTVTFDFTTPKTIAYDGGSDGVTGSGSISTGEDFKFGLFDTSTTVGAIDPITMAPVDFTGPVQSSSGTPNPGLNMAGIQCEVDNINAPGTDLGIRTHNVMNNAIAGDPTGRLFGTNTGFHFIAGGDDDVTSFLPDSDYTGTISLAYTDATLTSFEITVGMTGEGVNGPYNDVFTRTVTIDDVPFMMGDFFKMEPDTGSPGVNTTSFDLLVFGITTGGWGGTVGPCVGSSTVGEDNNGIDISNVTITFTDISEMGTPLKGDVNLSGVVDFFDIQPFIDQLSGGNQPEADVNCDGMVDFFDIQPFINVLAGNP